MQQKIVCQNAGKHRVLRVSALLSATVLTCLAGTSTAIAAEVGEIGSGFEVVASDAGFEVVDPNGSPVEVISTAVEEARSMTYIVNDAGKAGRLETLDWLSRPSGTDSEDRSGIQGSEKESLDGDGNLVIQGGVTAEQAYLPDEVEATPFVAILTTEDEVQIQLGELYGSEATVSRDGEVIGSTAEGSFIDSDVVDSAVYEYSVESVPVGMEQRSSARQKDITEQAFTDSEPVNTDRTSVVFQAVVLSDSDSLDASTAIDATAAALPTQSLNTWVHMTYIPQATVPINLFEGMACDGAEAFRGDNRGDKLPTASSFPSHRTAIRVAANWGNPSPYQLYWEKSTGITRKVVGGKVVATKQASPNGIKVLDTWVKSGVAHFDIRHDVADPFCKVGSVKYRETVQIWRSGVVAVNGRHNSVPNHESYASYNYDKWGNQKFVKVWKFSKASYPCLVGWMSWCDKSYTASKNF
ncbi:hypothetical protein N8K70_14395 [Microbacterium betulae]|uniref:Uncharacterized protein n=1 Tax=Microbacterium betulae TaxID=2981139 RepID=A0AA97FIB8_9MICO|nr:hypothetical protein [Microbacterium sp. AB]WOF22569.1 hypothetical protein N8K70_14395 [Microbacterium sp. AB]